MEQTKGIRIAAAQMARPPVVSLSPGPAGYRRSVGAYSCWPACLAASTSSQMEAGSMTVWRLLRLSTQS
jgi:hypothetical protein